MQTPATPPSRPRLASAAARTIGALTRARTLDPDAMLDRVRAQTGCDDFGDPWFLRPLHVLAEAIEAEARLNPLGRYLALAQFEKVLRDRLRAQRWFAARPEILARPLPHPVVVLGPMRSGTTRLHRLLAADHRLLHLRFFETLSPVPPEGADMRPLLGSIALGLIHGANPRTAAIHPTGAHQAEEELGLLVQSFWGMKHEAQWRVPGYGAWCRGEDATPAYRHLANLLRLVGWSQRESSLKPWLLKTPQHMLDLAALLAVFPDARLIFIHRDPLKVVGSAASLAWNQMVLHSDEVDAHEVGRTWLGKTREQVEAMRAARERVPPQRTIDVHYDAMDCDWRGVMRRVYAFLGLDIEPAWAGMEAYQRKAASLAAARRPHRYSLEAFGLTSGAVMDEMEDYVRAYDVPVDSTYGLAAREEVHRQ